MAGISFKLTPAPPFRLDLTVWALRRRPHNLVDLWDGRVYQRVLVVQDEPLALAVSQSGAPDNPELTVEAQSLNAPPPGAAAALKATLTRMLGLDTDLRGFYRFAGQDARLDPLVRRFQGVKPPRFPTLFEALANAVACQQLSLTAGIHLLNRLAAALGLAFPSQDGGWAAFPRPADLTGADPETFRRLGFSRSKGRSLVELAQGITAGRVDLDQLESLDDEEAVQYLEKMRGIGRWSAEYVLLRGLGRWHLFPGDDVGARNRLQAWLQLSEPLDYQGVRKALARWQPFGGLIYFHFLLSHLADEGHIKISA